MRGVLAGLSKGEKAGRPPPFIRPSGAERSEEPGTQGAAGPPAAFEAWTSLLGSGFVLRTPRNDGSRSPLSYSRRSSLSVSSVPHQPALNSARMALGS